MQPPPPLPPSLKSRLLLPTFLCFVLTILHIPRNRHRQRHLRRLRQTNLLFPPPLLHPTLLHLPDIRWRGPHLNVYIVPPLRVVDELSLAIQPHRALGMLRWVKQRNWELEVDGEGHGGEPRCAASEPATLGGGEEVDGVKEHVHEEWDIRILELLCERIKLEVPAPL